MFCVITNIKLRNGKYYAAVYNIHSVITGLSERCLNEVYKEYIEEDLEKIIIKDIPTSLDYEICIDLETLKTISNELIKNLLEILKYKNDKRVPTESICHVLYNNNVIDSNKILVKATVI